MLMLVPVNDSASEDEAWNFNKTLDPPSCALIGCDQPDYGDVDIVATQEEASAYKEDVESWCVAQMVWCVA